MWIYVICIRYTQTKIYDEFQLKWTIFKKLVNYLWTSLIMHEQPENVRVVFRRGKDASCLISKFESGNFRFLSETNPHARMHARTQTTGIII